MERLMIRFWFIIVAGATLSRVTAQSAELQNSRVRVLVAYFSKDGITKANTQVMHINFKKNQPQTL